MAARKVRVTGLVQGVYYRGSTQEKARALVLNGWVKNLANGQVESYIEGELAQVQRMLKWMETGPERAKVEMIEVENVDIENRTGFSILR